jgi:hypothetical protein
MTDQTTSTIPPAGGPTGQPVPDSLTVSGHSWSNLVMAGYPSACAKDDAVLRLTSAPNATKSRPFPICTAARPGHRAHDRRVLDVPLEVRLQSRTSELLALARTMLPVINRSVRDARAQIRSGHQDLRSYFLKATVATTDRRAATPTVRDARVQLKTGHQDLRSYFSQATVATTDHTAATRIVTSPARPNVPLLDIRQRFQSARTRMATLSSDIRQYFPGIADSTT